MELTKEEIDVIRASLYCYKDRLITVSIATGIPFNSTEIIKGLLNKLK